MKSIFLDFYGIKVNVSSDDGQTLSDIKRDFIFFYKDEIRKADITVISFIAEPPYKNVPKLKASLYSPNFICYDDGNMRYVDYNSKALTLYDYGNDTAQIYSLNPDIMHEITYLLILSRVGELLDKKGIHRVHALGVSINNNGILCLLPMGGGKTSLALELLRNEDIKLLGDDIPLITRNGLILPFILRVGVDEDINLNISSDYLREFKRREYRTKVLIDVDYFREKIGKDCMAKILLIGEREFSSRARILKMNKVSAFFAMAKNSIIGLGLPQLIEYFLRGDLKDIISKFRIIFSRTLACIKVVATAKAYKFILGRDKAVNAGEFMRFYKSVTGG